MDRRLVPTPQKTVGMELDHVTAQSTTVLGLSLGHKGRWFAGTCAGKDVGTKNLPSPVARSVREKQQRRSQQQLQEQEKCQQSARVTRMLMPFTCWVERQEVLV